MPRRFYEGNPWKAGLPGAQDPHKSVPYHDSKCRGGRVGRRGVAEGRARILSWIGVGCQRATRPPLQNQSCASETPACVVGFDLDFRAGRIIRNAEASFPLLHATPSGDLLFTYAYEDRKTVVAEAVSKDFESAKSCDVLQKADFSFGKCHFEARLLEVVGRHRCLRSRSPTRMARRVKRISLSAL
jgi:hypothetical protein